MPVTVGVILVGGGTYLVISKGFDIADSKYDIRGTISDGTHVVMQNMEHFGTTLVAKAGEYKGQICEKGKNIVILISD